MKPLPGWQGLYFPPLGNYGEAGILEGTEFCFSEDADTFHSKRGQNSVKTVIKSRMGSLSASAIRPSPDYRIELLAVQSERSIMIAVSGKTTPEESQAKEGLFLDEEDDNLWNGWKPDLWDDIDND